MDCPMRRLVWFLAAFALTAGVALAQDPGSFYKPPTKVSTSAAGVNPTGKAAAGGISALLTMQGVDDSGRAAAYKTRGITYAPSTLGRIARAARGGPAAILGALAFGALIDGAGWAIDSLTGQVLSGPPVAASAPPGTGYWTMNGNYFPTAASAGQWYASYMAANGFGQYAPTYDGLSGCSAPQPSGAYNCNFKIRFNNGGVNTYQTSYNPNNNPGVDRPYSFVTQPAPVPVAQVDNLLGNAVADRPDTWNQVLRDPDGRPRVTPEVQAALDAFRNELEAERGITATPTTPPDEDWAENPNPSATDWPGFCSWASVVCDFIDWYKSPPADFQDKEMPESELPGMAVWSSSLGQGSCPAPYTLSLTGTGAQEYSWEPWCDLASRIKPLVIASAAFAALLILAGVSRRSNGDA